MGTRRWWAIGIVFALAAAASAYIAAGALRRVTVQTAVVEEGVVGRTVTVTGKLAALRSAQVTSRRAGTIEEIVCRVGDEVQAGETIALMAAADLVGQRGVVPRTPSERLAQATTELQEAERVNRRLERVVEETREPLKQAQQRATEIDAAQVALREAERAQDDADSRLRQLETQSRWGLVAGLSADLEEKERQFTQATQELQRARAVWEAGEITADEYHALEAKRQGARRARDLAQQKLTKIRNTPQARAREAAQRVANAARAQVRVRRAELERAEGRAETLDDLGARLETAQARLLASDDYLVELRARVAALKQQERARERREKRTEVHLDTGYMTAPIPGTVLEINVESGGKVEAGQAVATIADLGSLMLQADVGPSRAAAIRVGQTACVYTPATGNRAFDGVVSRVEGRGQGTEDRGQGTTRTRSSAVDPSLSPVPRDPSPAVSSPVTPNLSPVPCRVELFVTDDLGTLRPGQAAEAVIDVGTEEPGMLVPRRALTRLAQGQQGVYVARDGKALAIAVAVAESGGTQARVIGELQVGDLVITDPPPELRDGRGVVVLDIDSDAHMLSPDGDRGGPSGP